MSPATKFEHLKDSFDYEAEILAILFLVTCTKIWMSISRLLNASFSRVLNNC